MNEAHKIPGHVPPERPPIPEPEPDTKAERRQWRSVMTGAYADGHWPF